jgi:NAD(P)-dependent dehydrogenase (short-subunit alcohol dehydrogenase family)
VNLAGISALVSGGASGLGAATTRRLCAAGARVTILDLPRAAEQAAALIADLEDRATYVPGDVTEWDDVGRAVDAAADRGALRAVVAAAGIAPTGRMTAGGQEAQQQFRRALEVNLVGTFTVIARAAAAMAALDPVGEERGVLVCTASIAAFDGQIGQAAYAASKAGVAGMTLPAARELARDRIRVVTIAPGLFETPMFAGVSDAVRESVAAQVPHPSRLGSPDEYAALVQHAIENAMLNGEVIRLDGAIRMGPR